MIVLSEHNSFQKDKDQINLSIEERAILNDENYLRLFKREKDEQLCFSLQYDESNNEYLFDSSYMIGIDWIVEGQIPIYVKPKLNKGTTEIDYLSMLFSALQDPENIKHLDNLYTIDFNKSLIEIEQKEDVLTPLLLMEFLSLVKQIVRKGLKKSYYPVVKNLNSRVKGKVLVNETIKRNHPKQKMTYNICKYEEFGYNSLENQLIKKALIFTESIIKNLKGFNTADLKQLFNYCRPAFEVVSSDIDIKQLNGIKPSPLFKEYQKTLLLAEIILKRYGFTISQTSTNKYKTPPFWIDMSKLFEMFVFKKLREKFPSKGEVIYHKKFNGLEPDYLINASTNSFKMIVDAKYKPKYLSENLKLDDVRQLSGYARLKSIYREFGIDNTREIIDCLIIYPDQELEEKSFVQEFESRFEEDKNYMRFYKIGVKLPENSIVQ